MEKLIVIKTLEELRKLRWYLKDKEFIAYDTETTGLDHSSEIIGLSVAAETEVGYYVVTKYWDVTSKSLVTLETQQEVHLLIEDLKAKNLVMHNAVYDCAVTLSNYKIDLMPSVHTDTLILGHLLNENRPNGLKELGVAIFSQFANREQQLMKESIKKSGGQITRESYELYKADADLIAKYGAKDAILTIQLFYHFIPILFEEGLEDFFYKNESMPLLRGATYELNTSGLKIDVQKLQDLKGTIEAECIEAKAFIHSEIKEYIKDKYPGTNKRNEFNIGSGEQLSWLLYNHLGNDFHALTDTGREICKALGHKLPYTAKARREFVKACIDNEGRPYDTSGAKPKTIKSFWKYLKSDKEALSKLEGRYKWVSKLLEYNKNQKILKTYVIGIQQRMKYGIIKPSFLQHGTTSGRYSSRNPNFQNLPRKDKRIKGCIVARPGKVFVGADYSQLEPRVFASVSGDNRLLKCFSDGDDFYSVVGVEVFGRKECSLKKDAPDAFASLYPSERDIAKVVTLSSTYGTTAPKMAPTIKRSIQEAQDIIDRYFLSFPSVYKFMLESHELAKANGRVISLFGRPRRMPEALEIKEIYGNSSHDELPYAVRNTLNLAVNHRVQSTAASIVNRASIAFCNKIKELNVEGCHIVLQVHDEIVAECQEKDSDLVAKILKDCMENTVQIPGVNLEAEPKVGITLAELK